MKNEEAARFMRAGRLFCAFLPEFFRKKRSFVENILVPWEIVCYTEVAFNNFFIIGMGNCSGIKRRIL